MSKISYFDIVLNKQNGAYLAGETVSGTVRFKVNVRFKIKQVKLTAYGDSYCFWSKSIQGGKSVSFFNYDTSFKYDFIFMGKESSDHDFYIEPGDYNFPFQLSLPSNLATSFESEDARTKYYFHAVVKVPIFSNFNALKSFTVINHLDLNQMPSVSKRLNLSTSHKVDFLCYKSESFEVTIKANKCGFVPGESILVDVAIKNQSNRSLNLKWVALCQKIMLTSMSDETRIDYVSIAKLDVNKPIKSNSEFSETNLELKIPAACPSSLHLCKIFQVNYVIKVYLKPSLIFAKEVEVEAPIIVGTIPISAKQLPFLLQPSETLDTKRSPLKHKNEKPSGTIVSSDTKSFTPLYPFYETLYDQHL